MRLGGSQAPFCTERPPRPHPNLGPTPAGLSCFRSPRRTPQPVSRPRNAPLGVPLPRVLAVALPRRSGRRGPSGAHRGEAPDAARERSCPRPPGAPLGSRRWSSVRPWTAVAVLCRCSGRPGVRCLRRFMTLPRPGAPRRHRPPRNRNRIFLGEKEFGKSGPVEVWAQGKLLVSLTPSLLPKSI